MTTRESATTHLNRRRVLGLASAFGAASIPGAAVIGAGAPDGPGRATSTAQIGTDQCQLPRFTDEYIGFSVGKPEGWGIDYLDGTIWLWPRNEDSVTAFVYPFRPQTDSSLDDFVSSYVGALEAGFAGQGGSLSVTDEGQLDGSIGGADVQGAMWVEELEPDIVIWGGWAPAERWDAYRNTIRELGSCYRREVGRYLTAGTVDGWGPTVSVTWRYVLPVSPVDVEPDWIVGWGGSERLHIFGDWNEELDGRNANVYRAIHPLLHTVGVFSPEDLAQYEATTRLGAEDWELVNWGEESPVFDSPSLLGQTQSQSFSFDARSGEHDLTGIMHVSVTDTGYGVLGTVMLHQALSTEWDRLAAITRIVMTNTGTVTTYPTPEQYNLNMGDIIMDMYDYRQRVSDEAADRWHEVMMGYETVEDETTGEQLWAPFNSYDPTSDCEYGYERVINTTTGETVCLRPVS